MFVPKLLLTPTKIWIFGPKTAKFGPKSAFLVILGQILPFFAHLVPCWLVGWWVWRGLYLARHLFTLSFFSQLRNFHKVMRFDDSVYVLTGEGQKNISFQENQCINHICRLSVFLILWASNFSIEEYSMAKKRPSLGQKCFFSSRLVDDQPNSVGHCKAHPGPSARTFWRPNDPNGPCWPKKAISGRKMPIVGSLRSGRSNWVGY